MVFAVIVCGIILVHYHLQRSATITPINEYAKAYGMSSFVYTPSPTAVNPQQGQGRIKIKLNSGEVLVGDYHQRRYQSGDTDAYRIQKQDAKAANYSGLVERTLGGRDDHKTKFTTIARGNRGTVMSCSFFLYSLASSGVGKCLSNRGAQYRLTF